MHFPAAPVARIAGGVTRAWHRAGSLIPALCFLASGLLIRTGDAFANPATTTVAGAAAQGNAIAPATPVAPAAAGSALPSSTGSVFSMLLGLIAVLAIMAGIAWLFKRFGLAQNLSGNSAARIIGGVNVGTRERVMVVEVGDQWIVVGVAPGRVNALATMPRQEHGGPAAHVPPGHGFSSWLKQTMDKRNQSGATGDRAGNDGSST